MEPTSHPTFRFIRSQGDLDGACLLYALLNARQALTGRRVTADAWSTAVLTLQNVGYFLNITQGSKDTDSNIKAEIERAEKFINALAPTEPLHVQTAENLKNGKLGQLQLTESSVVVCSNNEHWFCIVDADTTSTYVACSWVWQRDPRQYVERISPNHERVFNDVVAFGDLEFHKARALIVSSEPVRPNTALQGTLAIKPRNAG